jgi:hypothetical protein
VLWLAAAGESVAGGRSAARTAPVVKTAASAPAW